MLQELRVLRSGTLLVFSPAPQEQSQNPVLGAVSWGRGVCRDHVTSCNGHTGFESTGGIWLTAESPHARPMVRRCAGLPATERIMTLDVTARRWGPSVTCSFPT
ncbi:hypothetical protein AAFF_G00219140 [Aldrovandia affinis]|uniref:Uncharacterized protein n=1 Tax=Aldrovandia affinis TaxID=143900 RepID=A0AAD7SW84_9TELE|nr:hypothetical protein AAFF_G00219140 [Aldrovandia affinis]